MNTTMDKPFMYEDFREAFNSLKEALISEPVYALLLGESGSGKTTLLRLLAAELDRSSFHILYLCHSQATPSCLSRVLAEALHLPVRRSSAETNRLLVQTLRNLPVRLLLWIDEAQLVRDDTLHEIRLLAEADLDKPPLFSVILSALPKLKDRLLAPHIFPFWRRIRPKVILTGLRRGELDQFLNHCIDQNTAKRFESHALDTIFEHGRGIPAILFVLAESCLKAHPQGIINMEQVAEILDQTETSWGTS